MFILETKRLLLREASSHDAEFMLKLVNEPAWQEFIAEHSIDSIEKASKYIEQKMIANYQGLGFGLWIVETLEDSAPIGICGLLKRESLDFIDLGFAFLSRYWGQGFASEAALATLAYAASTLESPKVLAITKPANTGSQKVLEKVGFHYESSFSYPDDSEVLSLYAKT